MCYLVCNKINNCSQTFYDLIKSAKPTYFYFCLCNFSLIQRVSNRTGIRFLIKNCHEKNSSNHAQFSMTATLDFQMINTVRLFLFSLYSILRRLLGIYCLLPKYGGVRLLISGGFSSCCTFNWKFRLFESLEYSYYFFRIFH